MITPKEIAFAVRHRDDDVARLLLQGDRYPEMDMPIVAQQIEGWRQAQEKWPSLACCDLLWYPPRLNREQSSSEATARYKAALFVRPDDCLVDLTGGMGIDSLFAMRAGASVDYIERDDALCAGMAHNLEVLSAGQCRVHCADSIEWVARQGRHYDIIYIDPARRNAQGGKVSAFEDCTPNLLQHLDLLLNHCERMVIKASPMIDLATARRQLGQSLCETHIVAVKGECKEVLFVCRRKAGEGAEMVSCTNIEDPGQPELFIGRAFAFTTEEEAHAIPEFCQDVGRYLYEPHAALMKGGAFNLVCQRYDVKKLARNTHLYTADEPKAAFPGRVFEVIDIIALNTKSIRSILPEGKAHVVSRNYPVAADPLRKQLSLKEGGELFVIATTVGVRKTGLLCRRID